MRSEIKEKWLEALRSGEYKQTTGSLHDSTGFCCLGVLCDLYMKVADVTWEASDVHPFDDNRKRYYVAEDGEVLNADELLPGVVADWAGLDDIDPQIVSEDDGEVWSDTLSTLNDDGHTFEQIASYIEESL